MSSEMHTFSGTAKWARLKTPNKFDKYQINLYVDATTRAKIRGLGTRLVVKEDDDGFFYTFRRDHEKRMGSKLVEFGPPEVTMDGEDYDGFVGNGSHVTVHVEVYSWEHPEHGKGMGTRLHKVEINELVEWKPDDEEEAPEVVEVAKPASKARGKVSLAATPF